MAKKKRQKPGQFPLVLQGKVARAIEARAIANVKMPKARTKRRNMIRMAMEHGKVCHWCHRPVKFVWDDGVKPNQSDCATFEHVKTRVSGGSNGIINGVIACFRCNNLRGHISFDAFTDLIKSAGSIEMVRRFLYQRAEHERKHDEIVKANMERKLRRIYSMPLKDRISQEMTISIYDLYVKFISLGVVF